MPLQNAAEFYENAWEFSGKSDSSIGFKLAFNYLKAKRFVEAVDICHHVRLTMFEKQHPLLGTIRDGTARPCVELFLISLGYVGAQGGPQVSKDQEGGLRPCSARLAHVAGVLGSVGCLA